MQQADAIPVDAPESAIARVRFRTFLFMWHDFLALSPTGKSCQERPPANTDNRTRNSHNDPHKSRERLSVVVRLVSPHDLLTGGYRQKESRREQSSFDPKNCHCGHDLRLRRKRRRSDDRAADARLRASRSSQPRSRIGRQCGSALILRRSVSVSRSRLAARGRAVEEFGAALALILRGVKREIRIA